MIAKSVVPNRLAKEKSPYLLQHANNPVNWYPWGEEAFSKAKELDRPVFLSIGYSTCHWCHVMEKESFEDLEVANLLNENFISIKVDREERPDIDSVYMSVCQALTGQGGWPLTILMTQEQKPFYAGTYLPKFRRYDNIGMLALLTEVSKLWKTDRKRLLKSGDEIASYIEKQAQTFENPAQPKKELFRSALQQFQQRFDSQYGGFAVAPKFPAAHNLLFLLRYYSLEQDKEALCMVEKTLVQMYRGGIFDHIGGGFSRYSTDEKWLVPHFEKMLYDNALLAMAYLEAYRLTQKTMYETIARKTLDYILKELTYEKGGFFCGQDADSEGVEGKYYVFTSEEIVNELGQEDGGLFCEWFGITDEGNFEGKSIPNLLNNEDYESTSPYFKNLCKMIYQYRLSRTKLHKDDKILNSWNALAIVAFSRAYRILNEPQYLLAAQNSVQFIREYLIGPDGGLLVRWRDGEAAHTGNLEDYAFYANALLELYDGCFDIFYLQEAVGVTEKMISLFFDQENGGFYLYAKREKSLISHPKELYDGAMPSGNSVAALVLVRLAKLTGEVHWQELSDRQLAFLTGNIENYPSAHTVSLIAMAQELYPSSELVCICSDKIPVEGLHNFMNGLPNSPFILVKTKENQEILSELAPFTLTYPIPQTGESYYLCKNGSCLPPVTTVSELRNL